MYCLNCNEKISIPNAKFCKKCGAKLSNNSIPVKDSKNTSSNVTSIKKSGINKKLIFSLTILLILMVLGAAYYFLYKGNTSNVKSNTTTSSNNVATETDKKEETSKAATEDKKTENTTDTINKINSILNNQQGQYSIAYQSLTDSNNIEINSKKTKSASVIKVFIMVEAFNQIKNGTLNENREVVLTDQMKVQGSGILLKMESGTKFTINRLIEYMIDDSDNTAANILIDILGMNKINNTIQSLGCTDTILQRKMMDTDSINRGIDNYTSVKDLCLLFNKLYRNDYLGQEYDSKMIEIMKKQKNTEKIPVLLPQGVSVAHKTGELDKVENDGGIVFTPKGAYIICVLTDGTPNEEAKKNISEISKIIYDYNTSN